MSTAFSFNIKLLFWFLAVFSYPEIKDLRITSATQYNLIPMLPTLNFFLEINLIFYKLSNKEPLAVATWYINSTGSVVTTSLCRSMSQ